MAIVLVRGTVLAVPPIKSPLNRSFIYAIGVIYLIAMHFPLFHVSGSGLSIPGNVMTWICVSFCISIGMFQIIRAKAIRYSKLTIGLFLCCALMTIPLTYHHASVENSLYKILGLWGGFSLFTSIQQFIFSNKQKNRLIWFIVLACLIEVAIAYYQMIFNQRPEHNIASGIFPTPETFATFLSTGLLASGYLLCRHLKKYQKQISIASLLYLTPLFSIPLIMMTFSLTGWSATLVGLCIIFPYLYRFASRKRLWGWSCSAVTGVILGILLTQHFTHQGFKPELFNGIQPLQSTLTQTLDMFIEKPFTGYGYGHFEEEYVLYSARQHQLNINYPSPQPALVHPHNEILYWGIEGGILPVLAMLLAVLFILFRIHYAKSKTRLATLSLLFPIALHSQLDNLFSLSTIHWITLVILLFWTDQRIAKHKNIALKPTLVKLISLAAVLLPAVTSVYMGGILVTQYALSAYKKNQNTEILNTIQLPFIWTDQIMQNRLDLALAQEQINQLHNYKNWLLKLVRKQPRPEHYHSLIMLYMKMGDLNRANQTLLEAKYLFPDFNTTSDIDDKLSQ